MAGRRRSGRTNANGNAARSASPSNANEPEGGTSKPAEEEPERCPACPKEIGDVATETRDTEEWAMCGACKVWYHWRCTGHEEELSTVDKWFCKACREKDPKKHITYKAPARKSERKRTTRDYANLESGVPSDPQRWMRMMEGKPIKEDCFKRMEGADVGLEWVETDENALTEPIVIESTDGLGMKMPDTPFGVEDVALLVGENTPLEVIDVASQSTAPGWTLKRWVEYFNTEPDKREKILNVISLEISGTLLADRILPPRLVRELDWVENYWPSTKKGKGHTYPKVQLYCLMGVQGAWTDWHIDFAGSSVYYHIMDGSKVFYFIRPTPANLAAYERWSGSDMQSQTWLGDLVDEVVKVTLTAGNTMIIPTGWIHAVYTPVDTLVFGGNFLHSYNVATQLRVRDIEIKTHVPKKFRFPLFSKLCWYVGDKVLKDLKAGTSFSTRVLESIAALADFLVSEARVLERGSEPQKKEVKEQVPHDRVKDAPALARELRWRVQHALGSTSDDESSARDRNGHTNGNGVGVTRKRKRAGSESASETPPPRFKNFRPKPWDKVLETASDPRNRKLHAAKPDTDGPDWAKKWEDWKELEDGDGNEEVEVSSEEKVLTKVRKIADGLERERIQRVVEQWKWKT
ncbi:JmjC domain-containing histone demethylation protein 1 [Paramarasmius palmivorus]|uniref:JmjC domain-containing histone demethylation protein 1 n=1 Tax=Paramarasmius palmivorus TaxID=297713 RepID=A0AAW0DV02_9AGAR